MRRTKKRGMGSTLTGKKAQAWKALKKYHPYRYASYRDWASQLLKECQKLNHGKLVTTGLTPETGEDLTMWGKLGNLIVKHFEKAAIDVSEVDPTPYAKAVKDVVQAFREQRRGQDLPKGHPIERIVSVFLSDEVKLFAHWACHVSSNRAIFDFTTELTRMFANSELGEAVLDRILLPCESVYLHFGLQEQFPLRGRLYRAAEIQRESILEKVKANPEGVLGMSQGTLQKRFAATFAQKDGPFTPEYFLEGAYVSRNALEPEGSLEIVMIGRRIKEPYLDPPQNFLEARDEQIVYHIPSFHPGISVKEAIAREREAIVKGQADVIDDGRNAVIRLGEATTFVNRSTEEHMAIFRQKEAETAADFDRALNLVLNAVLYITAYPKEQESAYPPETPGDISKLIVRAEKADAPEKDLQRDRRELEDLGYVKIRFCGRRITQKVQDLAARNQAEGRSRTFKGRLGTWRYLDASKGHFKESRNVWVRPSPRSHWHKALDDL